MMNDDLQRQSAKYILFGISDGNSKNLNSLQGNLNNLINPPNR